MLCNSVLIDLGKAKFFVAQARCLSAGLRYLRLTRLPRHDRSPVPGGNRSAASCLCTVLLILMEVRRVVLGRTSCWSPKSDCVYGPENEIAAVFSFHRLSASARSINTLLHVLRRYTHESPGSQYFPELEFE